MVRKKFVNAVRPKTEIKARNEACVTRIDGVDDVVREESEEQRRDEKEEFGERKTTRMHDPRQPSQHERIEHEMTHRPFRSWCNIASREEDERRTVANQLHFGLHVHGRRDGRQHVGIFGGKRTSNKSCAQHRGPKEIDGRMDMPKAAGVAA